MIEHDGQSVGYFESGHIRIVCNEYETYFYNQGSQMIPTRYLLDVNLAKSYQEIFTDNSTSLEIWSGKSVFVQGGIFLGLNKDTWIELIEFIKNQRLQIDRDNSLNELIED